MKKLFNQLFNKWRRFEDEFPKHKSIITVTDCINQTQDFQFNILPDGKQYFFWLSNGSICEHDLEDRYPLWKYQDLCGFKTRYNKQTDKIEAYK